MDQLTNWIKENTNRGCTIESIVTNALQAGHSSDVINKAIDLANSTNTVATVPWPTTIENKVWCGDKSVDIIMSCTLPKCMLFDSFLSDEECDQLIEIAKDKLARSTTVDPLSTVQMVNPTRTSDGMFFQRGENSLVKTIEERISVAFNWPVSHSEGLQVLRYGAGKEYLPHNDYFLASDVSSNHHLARGGQRIGTFLMYLKTPLEGGETTMNDIGMKISPKKGNGFLFVYPSADALSKSLHGGAAVVQGEKFVATKWLRTGVFT